MNKFFAIIMPAALLAASAFSNQQPLTSKISNKNVVTTSLRNATSNNQSKEWAELNAALALKLPSTTEHLEITDTEDTRTIKLLTDFTADSDDTHLVVDSVKKKIVLDLNGHVINRNLDPYEPDYRNSDQIIRINAKSDINLTIDDSDPSIKHDGYLDANGLWRYDPDGTHVLGEGEIEKDLNGGIITGGSDCGIFCDTYVDVPTLNNRFITLNSGTIAGNTTVGRQIAAGILIQCMETTFTMNGGVVFGNCNFENSGGGVGLGQKGNFIMTGGVISDNISKYDGAGVRLGGNPTNTSKMTMTGGVISHNKSLGELGYTSGGVSADYGTLTIGGNAIIKNNTFIDRNDDNKEKIGNVSVYETSNKLPIVLADEGIAPRDGMQLGVDLLQSRKRTAGQITTNGTESDAKYFVSDSPYYYVAYNSSGYLELKQPTADERLVDTTTSIDNGLIYTDKQAAKVGDEVTLTVIPDAGHKFIEGSLKINGSSEGVTKTGDNKYKFTMPNEKAVITAEFKAVASSISIKSNPTKVQYKVGEELDLTGAVITAAYSDGSTKDINVTSDMVSGYDKTKVGDQTITITYDGQTTTFKITVVKVAPSVSLSTNAIIGIVAGSAALVWLACLIAYIVKRRKKHNLDLLKNKKKPLFANFTYQKKDTKAKGLQEYVVSFLYKGDKVIYFAFNNKGTELSAVKEEINRMKNNGELERYSKQYLKRNKKKGYSIWPIILFVVTGVAIPTAAGVTYHMLNNHGPEVKVNIPEINGLVISNTKAYVGEDFNTKLSVNKDLTGDYVLPDTLKKVESGNRVITATEYTYSVADNKEIGSLHIPGKYVEADITISLELVLPTPPGPTPVVSDYTEIVYHYSGEANVEGDHNIGFVFTTTENDVTVDWGDGTPVAVTSPVTSPVLENDATIKVYGDADEISFFDMTGNAAFYQPGNSYITSIIYSKVVKIIPMYSFVYEGRGVEPNLASVTISEGVEKIGMCSFYGCVNLKTVSIPSTVTEIGEMPFFMCSLDTIWVNPDNKMYSSEGSNLIDIKTKTLIQGSNSSSIPSGVETIEEYAFNNLKNLQNIVIPKTVTTIVDEAFSNTHIKSLSFESGSQLKTIPDYAFNDAIIDNFATLPNGIENINESAFAEATIGCLDKKLVLPNTLAIVARDAFANAKGFTELVLNADLKEIGSGRSTGSSFTGTEITKVDATAFTTTSFAVVKGQVFPISNPGFAIHVASEEVKTALVNSPDSGWAQYADCIKY